MICKKLRKKWCQERENFMVSFCHLVVICNGSAVFVKYGHSLQYAWVRRSTSEEIQTSLPPSTYVRPSGQPGEVSWPGDTHNALTDSSGVMIDMWNEIILDKFQRGALFLLVSFSVDSTLSPPFWFYKSEPGWLYLYSISSLVGGLDRSSISHYILCNCHRSQ